MSGARIARIPLVALALACVLAGLDAPAAEAGRYYEWYCRKDKPRNDTTHSPAKTPILPRVYNHPHVTVDDWQSTAEGTPMGAYDDYGHSNLGIDPETGFSFFQELNKIDHLQGKSDGFFLNMYDDDHPGVRSVTLIGDVDGDDDDEIKIWDISSNSSSFDKWMRRNNCGSASNAFLDNTGDGVSGAWQLDGRSAWQWQAPQGNPMRSDDAGYYWGRFEYQDRRGTYIGPNGNQHAYNAAIAVGVRAPGWDVWGWGASMVFDTYRSTDHTNLQDGSWASKTWDIGNGVSVREIDSDVPGVNGATHINPQMTFGIPALQFTARVTCNHLGRFWGNDFDPPGPHPTGCPQQADDTLPVLRMRDILLYIEDSEQPIFNAPESGLLDTSKFLRGAQPLNMTVFDGGSGVDHLQIGVRRYREGANPDPYGALQITGKTGNQACLLAGVQGPAGPSGGPFAGEPWRTTSRDNTRMGAGAFSVYSPSLVYPSVYGGGKIRWRTGPCPHYVQIDGNPVNTAASPFREGKNEIRLSADDFHIPNNQDTVAGVLSAQNGTDNTAELFRNILVDNVAPIIKDTTVSAIAGQGQITTVGTKNYARGTVRISGTAADDHRGPDKVAGTADDPNREESGARRYYIAGIKTMRLEMRRNNGAWEPLATQNISTGMGNADAVMNFNLQTASVCDGSELRFRTAATDAAQDQNGNGNSATQSDSSLAIETDNTAPKNNTQQPNGQQPNWTVTPNFTDTQPSSVGTGCGQGNYAGSGIDTVQHYVYDTAIANQTACNAAGGQWNPAGGPVSGCAVHVYSGPSGGAGSTYTITKDSEVSYLRASDRAGNVSAWGTVNPQIISDNQPPNLTVQGSRNSWNAGHNTDQQLTYSATDNSGVERIVLSRTDQAPLPPDAVCPAQPCGTGGNPFTVSDIFSPDTGIKRSVNNGPQQTLGVLGKEGVYRLQARAVDVYGNQSPLSSVLVRIDKSAPTFEIDSSLEGKTIASWKQLSVVGIDPRNGVFDSSNDHPSGPGLGHFELCPVGKDCGPNGTDWQVVDQPSADIGSPCTAKDPLSGAGSELVPDSIVAGSQNVQGEYHCRFNPSQVGEGKFYLRFVGKDVAGNTAHSERVEITLRPRTICPL